MLSKRLVVFLFCFYALDAAECDVYHVVRVRLIDQQQLSPDFLSEAREETAWVLNSLCVEPVWVSDRQIDAIEIRILAAPLTQDIPKQSLGISLVGAVHGLRGAVFLTRVRETQRTFAFDVRLARVLGCVVAHEIGHLLLASESHTSEGIMKADIGGKQARKASQRQLIFTPADRERLIAVHNTFTRVESGERR